MSIGPATSGYVTTRDGARLHFLQAGSGPTLVMIPGWSQSASEFRFQLEDLSRDFRCIALNMRGHGESSNVESGFSIPQFARDLHDTLETWNLSDVTLLGHSMGGAVIWSYWQQFASDRVQKLIIVESPPCMMRRPGWSPLECETAGAVMELRTVHQMTAALTGPDGDAFTRTMLTRSLDGCVSDADREWIIAENLKLPRRSAATLFLDLCERDWRDVIPTVTLPALVVAGRDSVIPWQSHHWMSQQMPNARLEVIERGDGGNHFLIMTAAPRFNAVVREFLSPLAPGRVASANLSDPRKSVSRQQ
ncbi:alpha/beta fold hydrolase [bacterium]|nr:alpha/beta fold hydrolase [bacterium]